MKYIWWQSYREWVFKGQWNWQKWPPGVQRKKDQQTGSPCSHLPSLFIENFRHFPSSTLTKLFPEPPVVAFRRPKSIRDTLVRAAVSKPSSTVGQCKSCGDKHCNCCLQLQHTQVFYSKTTGKEYKIFCNVNCKTPNVVYLLAICRRKCPTIQQKNKWIQKWPYEKDALARVSTLWVTGALIGWLWQI